jgi:capsular polysaccharide biosynthesis protein
LAKASDVSTCDLLPWADALGGRHEVARARLFDGGAVIPARPMLWPCASPAVQEAHLSDRTVDDVDVYVVRKGQVGGWGGQPALDGQPLYGRCAYPGYVRHWIDEQITPEYWAFEPRRLRKLRLARGFAVLHFNLVWGHWLTEMFPKLFALQALAERGVTAPLILPSTAPAYVRQIIDDVLPGQQVVVYDPAREYVTADQLILLPMLQQWYLFHPWFGERLGRYAAAAGTRGGRRIFVSRAGLEGAGSYREMSNGPEIEALAEAEGFELVRPESLSWREQLRTFAEADVIAGEFGSGLHNALFAPSGAKVLALNWIVDVQSRITNFRGQDIGYLLPDDGEPRGYSLGQPTQRFRIDPAAFREHVRALADAPAAAH